MRNKKTVILRFLPMLAVMGIIFFFSTMEGDDSADTSGIFLKAVVKLVEEMSKHGLSASALTTLHFIIRKIAHFTEYMALGLCIMYAIYYMWHVHKASLVLPELIAFLYACTDEFHQYFVPGRYGTVGDVLLDSTGALAGILVYYAIYKHLQIPKKERLSRKSAKRLREKARKSNKKENLIV